MKAKILAAARQLFGDYGYHGTTTRMIAKHVGIDISTLYYHWGDKPDLYEAVIADLNEEIRLKLKEVEKQVHGASLKFRIETAIDMMCDYLFSHPGVSNLILFRYFNKTRHEGEIDFTVPEHINNIAMAMGLAPDHTRVPVAARARVLAFWNSVFNFVSGEDFFRPMLEVDRDAYIKTVKETIKFIMIPPFTGQAANGAGPGNDE